MEVENKNQKKNYLKTFYEKHPDKKNEKIVCPDCGNTYSYFNKSKHLKTKLHNLVIQQLKIKS